MNERARRVTGALLGVLSLVVVGAGIAWACTPSADFNSLTPSTGPSGTGSTAVGGQFVPAEEGGRVEIRWESSAGPLLASVPTDQAGSFTARVTIPQDSPGVHTVVAVGLDAAGSEAGQKSVAFTIIEPSASASGSTGGGSEVAGNTSATSKGNPGTASNRDSGAGNGEGGKGAGDAPSAVPDAAGGGVSTAGGGEVFSGSQAATGTSQNGSGAASQGDAPAASQGSALGDLWAGFSGESSLGTGAGDPGVGADGRSGPQFAIGIALLGLGLLGLMAGFLVAAARKRRTEVQP